MIDPKQQTRVSETPEPDPLVGRELEGGYRIDEVLGRGGMGVVYKATQLSLGRTVAIKVLPVEAAGKEQFIERFHREADVLSKLNHPNIVTVFDRGEYDGHPYVVMEYVAGTSLRDVMKSGPLPPPEALAIVRSVLSALEHAHGHGIVHRDVKPENVLLAQGGVVKVADFGLSRLLGPEELTRLTRTHTLLGTYEYMAPEQRERSAEADARADLYATGVVLYEMIAGDLPIGNFDPLSRKRPGECDRRLDDLVAKSLEKSPERRFQDAIAMADAVSALLDSKAPNEGARSALLSSAAARADFDPLRFATRLDLLATLTTLLGVALFAGAFAWLMAATVGEVFVWPDYGRGYGSSQGYYQTMQSVGYAVPCLFFCMLGWFALETASGLRRFRPGSNVAQGILALLAAPTMILLPYSLFSWWLLHTFRGRVYFEGRARGLSAPDAVTSITQVALADPDAPLNRPTATRTHHVPTSGWTWLTATLISGLWVAAFHLIYDHWMRPIEGALLGVAILASYWLVAVMPRVYRSSERGPYYALVGIVIFAAIVAVGCASMSSQMVEHVKR